MNHLDEAIHIPAKKFLKEDINFLEYPLWIVNEKSKTYTWVIEKPHGRYEISSLKGLPNHFDRLVLYFLLSKLYSETQFQSLEIRTTRYEIARHLIEDQKIGGESTFQRIMQSLKKLQATNISFEGIFYEGDKYTTRFFGIIDDVVHNKETREVYIRFNQQYIQQLCNTNYSKINDFNEYKKLKRPIAARLYEILSKTFKDRPLWSIGIAALAEKLTLDKRPNTKNYYPCDILSNLKPAIEEINAKMSLKINLNYDKEARVCHFRSLSLDLSPEHANSEIEAPPVQLNNKEKSSLSPSQLVAFKQLLGLGIAQETSQDILRDYPLEKILPKIQSLRKSGQAVNNIGTWLLDTLAQEAEKDKRLAFLKQEHTLYKKNKTQGLFNQLPNRLKEEFNSEFSMWLKTYGPGGHTEEECKDAFLGTKLLDKEDNDFILWAQLQGYQGTSC